jgi:nickel transport system substrate-binding protein
VSRTKSGDDDAEVVFHRHDQYWQGAPNVEKLIIKHYATSGDVANALLGGSLDMVVGDGVLAPTDLIAFRTERSTKFHTFMSPVLMHSLVIINSGKEPTTDIALRKAIIHGVDKASIIEKEFGGLGDPVDRLFPSSAPYSDVALTPRWDYDFEKAQMLNCPEPSTVDGDGQQVSGTVATRMIRSLGLLLGLNLVSRCVRPPFSLR